MKTSSLAAGLKAASHKIQVIPSAKAETVKTVLIGAHFSPEVRRALHLIQARPQYSGRTLKQILGEAINDFCAKNGTPQPYSGEA